MQDNKIRMLAGPESLRAYHQLTTLEIEYRQSGMIYDCPSGRHDDVAISCAMLVWAALHPHLAYWSRVLQPRTSAVLPQRSLFGLRDYGCNKV